MRPDIADRPPATSEEGGALTPAVSEAGLASRFLSRVLGLPSDHRLLILGGLAAYSCAVLAVMNNAILQVGASGGEPGRSIAWVLGLAWGLGLVPTSIALHLVGPSSGRPSSRLVMLVGIAGGLMYSLLAVAELLTQVRYFEAYTVVMLSQAAVHAWMFFVMLIARQGSVFEDPVIWVGLINGGLGLVKATCMLAVLWQASAGVPNGDASRSLVQVALSATQYVSYVAYPTWSYLIGRTLLRSGAPAPLGTTR